MSRLREVTSREFDVHVLQGGRPTVVDFYAPWCGPCRMLAPLLEEIAGRYGDRVQFVKVNIDEAPDLANRYRVSGVPTLVLFFGGNEVDRVVGLPPQAVLDQKIGGLAQLAPSTS